MRRRNDERLKEEIEARLALQTAENIGAGMPPAKAHRQAKLKFGAADAVREDYRAGQGLPFIESLLRDVRRSFRVPRKSPAFTAVAIITLALGIGANTAIFALIDGIMLRNLPVSEPAGLYRLGDTHQCCNIGRVQSRWTIFSYPL